MKVTSRLLLLLCLSFVITAFAKDGRVVTFHLQQAPFSARVFAINNHGETAGTVGTEIGDQQGFVWAHGRFREVFEFDFVPNVLLQTQVFGINDFGQTIGVFASLIPGEDYLAFVRNRHGHATRLPLVNDASVALPFDINNAGTIVGWYQGQLQDPFNVAGFILRTGHYTSLVYPGALYTQATAINNKGIAVGWYSIDFNTQRIAFIYAKGRFQTTYQCLADGVMQSTEPSGINDFGQIVGNCAGRMFLRDAAGTITFLDPAGLPSPTVTGINNHGDIAGYFRNTDTPALRWDSFVMYRAVRIHKSGHGDR